jgi:tetratricopeptide (TPR) repeat protein
MSRQTRAPFDRAQLETAINAAIAALRRGDLKSGDAILQDVLTRVPGQPNALHLRGVVALQDGRRSDAIRLMQQAVTGDGSLASARSDLAHALTLDGRLDDAEAHLRRALALRPAFPEAEVNLGNVHRARAQLLLAEAAYRRALQLRPAFPEALSNLADILLSLGRPAEAEAAARQSIAQRANHAPGYQVLGRVLDALGRLAPSLEAHDRAIALDPTNAQAHADRAATLIAFGRRDEAIAGYRQALLRSPANAEWLRMLGKLDAEQSSLADARKRYTVAAPGSDERAHLGFHLGKLLEEAGEFPEALDVLLDANRIVRDGYTYDPADSERAVADIVASFSAALFAERAGTGDSDPTPIFVLGMPRSGTTLVEQIIASHPDVFGAGELSLMRDVVAAAFATTGTSSYADLVARQDDAALAAMGRSYIARLRDYSPTARRITDKMPGNFLLIGMIKLALPNARVIHCVRDPADTGISIFKNYFARGLGALRYAYDLGEIGHYHRLYQTLMQHWHTVLPGFVHDVSYEALVADQEGETRRLLDACGLDFRPETLAFFKTERPVHTASLAQVRSPISAASIGIAERYGDGLAPLRAALRGERPAS